MNQSTDWEQHYREKETPWDKGAPAPPLLEWMEANPGQISGSVLVPGCGTGHDVRAIVANGGDDLLRVVGLDISPTAVARAEEFPRLGKESFQQGNLFDLHPDNQGTFDWIWEHTCFCAIDPQRRPDYVSAVKSALKPGGNFLGVFYLDPYDEEHAPGEGPPHGCSIEELESLFEKDGGFTMAETRVPNSSYPGREGLELLVRMTR